MERLKNVTLDYVTTLVSESSPLHVDKIRKSSEHNVSGPYACVSERVCGCTCAQWYLSIDSFVGGGGTKNSVLSSSSSPQCV